MRYISVLLTLLFLNACSSKKQAVHHSHTMKLQKELSVHFVGPDKVSFLISSSKHKDMTLKVFAVMADKEKTLLVSKDIDHSAEATFSLPDDIETYTYIVALIEGSDLNGNKISSVETYKVGEQEQINRAKKAISNN
ncbi:MAG: hypothetical protein ACRBBP_06335 [Bdellovibrionales bacterium]